MHVHSYYVQALTHLLLRVNLLLTARVPVVAALAPVKSSELTHSNMLLFLVLKQSAAEHHGGSLCGQAELKGWMALRAIHNPKAEYLRCLVGVPILASKLRPNANAFPQSIVLCTRG